jgi:hypothetical protein
LVPIPTLPFPLCAFFKLVLPPCPVKKAHQSLLRLNKFEVRHFVMPMPYCAVTPLGIKCNLTAGIMVKKDKGNIRQTKFPDSHIPISSTVSG